MENWYQLKIIIISFVICVAHGQEWPPPNYIDYIQQWINTVTAENCQGLTTLELRLPGDTLAQLPTYVQISDPDYAVEQNRSNLVYQHNLALSRGMFHSFINQRMNESEDFENQPGWLYYYTSVWSDTVSLESRGSGLFYDENMMYANWYRTLPFNLTLPLYGPRTWKGINNFDSSDYGAGDNNNYTSPTYKHNPWYSNYLPDDDSSLDGVRKFTYIIKLKYAGSEPEYSYIRGSRIVDVTEYLPVTYTVPYFDCNRSNKWIVSAVSPFLDYLPRYLEWSHLRRHNFTGVSVTDVDFESIDINQCPLSIGNEPPNAFAGTAMCKSTTTCEPLPGFGFQRGGYQCQCLPGMIYPPEQDGPFQGQDIENSTRDEYEEGFDCLDPKTEKEHVHVKGRNLDRSSSSQPLDKKHAKWHPRYQFVQTKDKKNNEFKDKTDKLNKLLKLVSNEKIREYPPELAYKAEVQFEIQAKLAFRLAHFLSSYLQSVEPDKEDDPSIRPDKQFHIDHIYGEVLSIVMADVNVAGVGAYFDEGKFVSSGDENSTYFAPYSSKESNPTDYDYSVEDAAEFEPIYTEESWFIRLKDQFENNTAGLSKFEMNTNVRSNTEGDNIISHPRSPLYYYGADLSDGIWTGPSRKIIGEDSRVVISYAVPFFGHDSTGSIVEFHGAVTVDIQLDNLSVDQCDTSPYNVFGNTAKCNYQISKCHNLGWKKLKIGGYRCVCLKDHTKWIEGLELETEYKKMVKGVKNNFETLYDKC